VTQIYAQIDFLYYQVTPIYAQIDSIDWYQYFSIWESLTPGMRRVSELVGVQESFLAKAVRGRILTNTSAQLRLLAIHKRFYTALVLHDLVQETPLPVVAQKYNCNKGQLQSLQQSAATFAGKCMIFMSNLNCRFHQADFCFMTGRGNCLVVLLQNMAWVCHNSAYISDKPT
jgi:DNA polymerase theta